MSRQVEDWRTVTGPMAWCSHCHFAYHGDSDRNAQKAVAAAKRHAREAGHDVIVERGQSRLVKP